MPIAKSVSCARVLAAGGVGVFALALAGCAPAPRVEPAPPVPTPVSAEARYPTVLAEDVSVATERLYSLQVDRASRAEALRAFASRAGLTLNLQLRPDDTISLELVDKPLREVLDALVLGCACDYRLESGRLSLLPDTPVSRSYALEYLNLKRSLDARLGLATRVGNLSLNPGSDSGGGNVSSATIRSAGEQDIWRAVDAGLRGVLQIPNADPRVQVVPAAGLVVVHARRRQHRQVVDYLAKLQSHALRQVSIEAQVVEVELHENHATGVDWSEVASHEGFGWLQSMSSGFLQAVQQGGSSLQYSASDGSRDTRVLVNLLQQYGDVRVLSAPRVVALNNQPSVLSVVENKVYFSSSVQTQSKDDDGLRSESVETAIHTVPVGLVMQVTPQVSTGGEVLMSIRPTVSRVSGYVNDPNPGLAEAGIVSRIPEIQVRELETVLRVADGETIVLGGMMQLRDQSDERAVPWLHQLPLLGQLFRSHSRAARQAELLVLLTPTVVSAEGAP